MKDARMTWEGRGRREEGREGRRKERREGRGTYHFDTEGQGVLQGEDPSPSLPSCLPKRRPNIVRPPSLPPFLLPSLLLPPPACSACF